MRRFLLATAAAGALGVGLFSSGCYARGYVRASVPVGVGVGVYADGPYYGYPAVYEPYYYAPGPVYSAAQLAFVSVVTVLLYAVFLYTQTIRHRDYFVGSANEAAAHGEVMSDRMLAISVALLLLAVLAVVLLAKKFSVVVDVVTAKIGAPTAFAGLLVAVLVLLPESVAAISAARKNDLQKSINLALGSSIATIGLTVPAVAVAAYALDQQLVLGLSNQHMLILLLTFMLSMLTFGTGRTNILFGMVHMVVFAVFVFMVFVP